MRPDIAKATLQFMSRVQLNAQEIPAFQGCCQALQEEASKPEVVEEMNDGSPTIHAESDAG